MLRTIQFGSLTYFAPFNMEPSVNGPKYLFFRTLPFAEVSQPDVKFDSIQDPATNILKLEPRTTLFIVSCTKEKIWDEKIGVLSCLCYQSG